MKMLVSLWLAASTLCVGAGTFYFNQWFTNWTPVVGDSSSHWSSNWFAVPVGTLATVQGELDQGFTGATVLTRAYPNATITGPPVPVLGPCVVGVRLASSETNGAVVLWKLESVGVADDLGAVAIQPAGFGATVAMQTSTNLTTWQTMTNASFGPTNANRFFRLSLAIP